MTTTDTAKFAVSTAPATEADEQFLQRWSVAHLADSEKWLVRRGLGPWDNPALTVARRQYSSSDMSPDDLRGELAAFTERRLAVPDSPAPADVPGLRTLVNRLAADLNLYRGSLAQGGVTHVRVVPTDGGVTPAFLVGTAELFYPRWLLTAVPTRLFDTRSSFGHERVASTSWVIFQTPVIAIGRGLRTVAQHLDILEYDYP